MPINADGKFIATFDDGVPSEFSGITTTESVQMFDGIGTGTNVFSGNFLRNITPTDTNDTEAPGLKTTLTLENLPSHTSIDLNFLLALMDTWDGNFINPGGRFTYGPDFFNVTVDGQEIFKNAFHNSSPPSQDYVPPAEVELVGEQNLFTDPLGFKQELDSAYDMGLDPDFDNIPHTADTLTIEWFADGAGWQGDKNGNRDESWAIDNVEVVLNGLDIDTTAPSVDTTNGFAPVDDADDVAADTNLVITFDEPIQAGTGNIIIT
ncbi:MAG: Ig-like domain-containing protein, partial [Cyanobacteria bacterium J06633_8]